MSDKLQEAIKKRDDYLKENPRLEKFQKEIDSILDKTTDPQARLEAVTLLLAGKMNELKTALHNLHHALESVSKK